MAPTGNAERRKRRGRGERRKELSGFLDMIATPSKKEAFPAARWNGCFRRRHGAVSFSQASDSGENKTPEKIFTTGCFQSVGDGEARGETIGFALWEKIGISATMRGNLVTAAARSRLLASPFCILEH